MKRLDVFSLLHDLHITDYLSFVIINLMDENELQQEHDKKTKQREKMIKTLLYLMTMLVITFVAIGILTKLGFI